MKRTLITLLAALALAAPSARAQQPDRVMLSVRNDNMVLVREVRTIEEALKAGVNVVRIRDVAATIDATSVSFRSLTDPAAKVLEQNYEFDLVNADKMLEKYIDKEITVFTKDNKQYKGLLMSFDARQIVLTQDKEKGPIFMVERGDNIQRVQFSELPMGLLTRPTLVWELESAKPGKQQIELSYLASNMNWRCDYNVVLNPDDSAVDLTGWVTISNNVGTSYNNATVKLVASAPRIDYRQMMFTYGPDYYKTLSQIAMTAERGDEKSRTLGDYRIYDLPVKTEVKASQIKQVEMIKGLKIPLKKIYLYDGAKMQWYWYNPIREQMYGQENKKVNVLVEFENTKQGDLGVALPAGKVRVYKQDSDKSLEFVGEDMISHTPREEKVTLYVGDAFDIVGERKQTSFKHPTPDIIIESFEVKLRNHKKEDVTVDVLEKMYRCAEWDITAKSHDFEKRDSRTVVFPVKVPADKEVVVTYTVRYVFPR